MELRAGGSSVVGAHTCMNRRGLLCFALTLVLLAGTLAYAQSANPIPWNLESLTPDAGTGPVYVWGGALYGTQTQARQGANSTTIGTTLLLNRITSSTPASATYDFELSDLKDLKGHAYNFTLYVPANLAFASNLSSLVVSVGGETLRTLPTLAENVSWNPSGVVYVPDPATELATPGPFAVPARGPFLPLSFQARTLAQNTTIPVSITVPAYGQLYVSVLVLTVDLQVPSVNTPIAGSMGLLILPFSALSVTAVFVFLRKFSAERYAGTLAAAFAVQVVLAPFFTHPDEVSLSHFDVLFFNFGIVNLNSWPYGLLWYGTNLLPPAPLYAAGITPSYGSWNLLLKLPAIVADLLTFLVLVRLLTPRLGESRAYSIATVGWLFNPLVVYYATGHGLGESVVALFVTLTAYAILSRRMWTTVAGILAAGLTILPGLMIAIPALFSRRTTWAGRAALVAVPLAAYAGASLLFYGSPAGLFAQYPAIVGGMEPSTLVLTSASSSPMSYLFLLDQWLGLYLFPLIGVAALLAVVVLLLPMKRELLPNYGMIATYGSLLAFYLTYEVFYVQHWLWSVPVFIGSVALAPRVRADRSLAFVTVVSTLALGLNLLIDHVPYAVADLAGVLFVALIVPVFLWLPTHGSHPTRAKSIRLALSGIGTGLSVAIAVGLATSGSTSIDGLSLCAVSGGGFFVLGTGLILPDTKRLGAMVTAAEVLSVAGSLLVLYAVTASASPEIRGLALALEGVALVELGHLIIRGLRTPVPVRRIEATTLPA